jgi:hypothetical protein
LAESTNDTARSCPTRASGNAPLIVQRISLGTCFERQRRNYHKCFTCAFRGVGAGERAPVPARKGKSS